MNAHTNYVLCPLPTVGEVVQLSICPSVCFSLPLGQQWCNLGLWLVVTTAGNQTH